MLFQRSTKTAALCMYVHVWYMYVHYMQRFLALLRSTDLPSTNSFVYTIIGATPTKSEVHMYPYIIHHHPYIHVCIYVRTVLFGRKESPSLARQMSQLLYGVILDIITKKSHIRTQNDSFPLSWMVFLYVHVCAKGQAC